VVRSPFFAIAFTVVVVVLIAVRFILKAVTAPYQRLALRSVYAVSVIVTIVLAAYWLLNTPTATSIS
jgi:hypothetical protein